MTLVMSAVFGAGIMLAVILVCFKLHTKEKWQAFELEMATQRKHADKVTAENSKLRVALAAGEMTEEGKKVAAMTMAALDVVIATDKVAKLSGNSAPEAFAVSK